MCKENKLDGINLFKHEIILYVLTLLLKFSSVGVYQRFNFFLTFLEIHFKFNVVVQACFECIKLILGVASGLYSFIILGGELVESFTDSVHFIFDLRHFYLVGPKRAYISEYLASNSKSNFLYQSSSYGPNGN